MSTAYVDDLLELIEKRKAYELALIDYISTRKPIDEEIEKRKDYVELERYLELYLEDYEPSENEKAIIAYIGKLVGDDQKSAGFNVEEFCEWIVRLKNEPEYRNELLMSDEDLPRTLDEPTEDEIKAFLCIKYNRLDELKKLESIRTEVRHRSMTSSTMLMYAISLQRFDVIRFLVEERNANKDVIDNHGRSALQIIALNAQNNEILDYLMEAGFAELNKNFELNKILFNDDPSAIDLTCVDEFGATPLHYIAARGRCDILEELNRLDVDFYVKDKNCMTCFDYAVSNNRLDMLEMLLEKCGLQRDYSEVVIQSIIEKAVISSRLDIVKWWFKTVQSIPNDVINKMLHKIRVHANEKDIKETIGYLLDAANFEEGRFTPPNLNELDSQGNTIVMNLASLEYNLEAPSVSLVEFLVTKGVDLNIRNATSNIGLMFHAVESGNIELVNYLLRKDVKLNDIYSDGNTNLSIAVETGNIEMVEFLLANSLSPGILNKSNKNDLTALDIAMKKKYDRIIDLLKAVHAESTVGEDLNNSDVHNCIPFKKFIPYPQLLLVDLDQLDDWTVVGVNGKNVDIRPWCFDKFCQDLANERVRDVGNYGTVIDSDEIKEEIEYRHYCSSLKKDFLKLSIKKMDRMGLKKCKTRYNSSLLHISAAYGLNEVIIWLYFNEKFNMKSVDDYGQTALYYAVMNNRPKTIILLKLFGLNELYIGECKFMHAHVHQYYIGADDEFHEKLVVLQILNGIKAYNKYTVPQKYLQVFKSRDDG